jgi:Tol biopolymer transport system component
LLKAFPAAALTAHQVCQAVAQDALPGSVTGAGRKGVMLMNRIGPSSAELHIANADGTGERKFLQNSMFEYNACFSPNGESVLFTSERKGAGQSDVFRARLDGTGIEPLITSPAVDDAAVLSPDGTRVAFVSTRNGYRANIWVLDQERGQMSNLTGAEDVQGDPSGPNCFFRPSWSPDSKWLAFSSDRNTDWRGHDDGHGWEHTQELSIYVIRADGQGFRRIASKPGYCLGSPKWSSDGRRVVFYEMTTEETWGARRPNLVAKVVSQIVSVDVATGERIEHTSGPGLKVFPQFLSATEIAYHRKGGPDEGLYYTSRRPGVRAALRSPTWSPDGKTVIYEKVDFKPRPQGQLLHSWDPDWEYRHTDVFPALSRDGKLVITEKAQNSSIAIMDPDGSNRKRIFEAASAGLDPAKVARGMAGAFAPSWSPDGQWIAFGLGEWFQERRTSKARIMRVRRDGTGVEALTDGTVHSGFPSYSADGKQIVYRVWGEDNLGLRILNLEDRTTRVLTTGYDNLPGWSPDGSRILFTRRVDAVNFDVFTIRPDGSDLLRLTTNRATDGHAVWTADGRIMWNSGIYGFRDEAALYDNTFQQYGQIFIMNADGSGKRMLTDSRWEDSMPLYIPAKAL